MKEKLIRLNSVLVCMRFRICRYVAALSLRIVTYVMLFTGNISTVAAKKTTAKTEVLEKKRSRQLQTEGVMFVK
jgi:hypothetical protein